jgi:hypothetical protein
LLAEYVILLAQEVDDLELTVVDPARHPADQEPRSFGAHRGTMVALPVIDLEAATRTPTLGYASYFLPAGSGTRRDPRR